MGMGPEDNIMYKSMREAASTRIQKNLSGGLQDSLYPKERVNLKQEVDPNGIDSHAPGAKLDGGKQRPSLIYDSMARALAGVTQVGTFGANKYSDGGWLQVERGVERYRDAQLRHEIKRANGELMDPDSGLPHDFHIAWNVLAQVELKARSGVYDVRQ